MTDQNRRGFLKHSALTAAGVGAVSTASGFAREESETGTVVPTDFREALLECLGGPWPEPGELNPRVQRSEQRDGYRLEWISYEVEPDDRVPAVLLIPDDVTAQSPAPGITIWHQHAGQWHLGKSEPAGLDGRPKRQPRCLWARCPRDS